MINEISFIFFLLHPHYSMLQLKEEERDLSTSSKKIHGLGRQKYYLVIRVFDNS